MRHVTVSPPHLSPPGAVFLSPPPSLSLSSHALASGAAVAAAPAISDRRASIPSTHTCLASSSTHPRAHLSRSTAEIASPSTWPLEDSPHMSISLPAFFAQTEHGVSITASPSTFPSPSFFHSERWAPICAPLAETGTTSFGNPVPPVLI